MHNIKLTDLVSVGGLIIASISLGWNVLNEIRKTPKAKVHCYLGELFPSDGKYYLVIVIANQGMRPIRINGIATVGYKWYWPPWKKVNYIIHPRALPIYLKDGEQHLETFAYDSKQFESILTDNIQSILVFDSLGGNHRLPRRKMFDLRKQIRNHLAKKAYRSSVELND